jgi:serine/threonine-protein phosphatase 2A regulatory subunit B
MTTKGPHDWKFQQVFGDTKSEEAVDADIISAVEFDHSGNYLAIGDRGGRVVILERNKNKRGAEYRVMTEFQSHEPEFDYLKSLEIEEKINKIKWLHPTGFNSHFLLTSNDKTIKLWKVYEKQAKKISGLNLNGSLKNASSLKELKIPRVAKGEKAITHTPKKIYGSAHAYHINSISLNSDGETFISADDLRINLWHANYTKESHTIVDIKPPNMEDLSEVITSASFHPSQCNTFMYSSSKGTIKLGDLRQSSTCNSFYKTFEVEEDPSSKTFFSEIIASVSDAKFSPDGKYILSRDYMTLKVWDVAMEKQPLKVLNIHEPLRAKLCDLYENDCIFDKFECSFSGDGNYLLTGSYKNYLHIFDRQGKSHSQIEASTMPSLKKKSMSKTGILGRKKKKDDVFENADFTKKCLHLAWHPEDNIIAVSSVNSLFIFASMN